MRLPPALALTVCIAMTAPMPNATAPPAKIYKILTPDQWTELSRDGQTQGSPLDQADGFIHFSTRAQLRGTLDKHFAGAGPLLLAAIPIGALAHLDLRWDAARGGDLFPHLYDALRRDAISSHWPLHEDAQGRYALPGEMESDT